MPIGVVAGVVAMVIAWKNIRLKTLAMETIEELAAVTWPTKQETYTATVVVLTTVVASAGDLRAGPLLELDHQRHLPELTVPTVARPSPAGRVPTP
ncbi:MAG: preprotein translocase subunit SecE [Deltaproteobacteria bacterium]|nr:preprotein translocase subunit SecE [Deltaproteobacteria bacterium]